MKEKVNFFTVIVSSLLLSSLILTGCMMSITSDTGDTKPYDYTAMADGSENDTPSSENNLDDIVDNAPTSQFFMKRKFHYHLEEDEGKLTVYTYNYKNPSQASKERTPLTYEEILFLIDDSINLYFSYNEIYLPSANANEILPSSIKFAAIQSSSSCFIKPYHGDYSEFEDRESALKRYNSVIEEIYAIIYYRISMHDHGFSKVFRCENDVILGKSSYASAVPDTVYQVLTIDGSKDLGLENEEKTVSEYEKIVQWEREQYKSSIDPEQELPKLNSKMLVTKTMNDERRPMEFKFIIYDNDMTASVVYPTSELESMMPLSVFYYEATTQFGTAYKPCFEINYEEKTFAMSASAHLSFALIGSFDEQDGVLKLYPENADDYGTYSYVFHKNGDTYVYVKEDSKAIAFTGFIWPDGLVFENIYIYTSSHPIPKPPADSEQSTPDTDTSDPLPNKTDESHSVVLKLDTNGDYCSLMISGDSVIDGSYLKEDDKLVFLLKSTEGFYQYYFKYEKENVYAYQKGLSLPYPGCEFEDETKFTLTGLESSATRHLEISTD